MTFKSFYRYATGMRLKCIRKNVLFQHQENHFNLIDRRVKDFGGVFDEGCQRRHWT
jgi:hypothetical protein